MDQPGRMHTLDFAMANAIASCCDGGRSIPGAEKWLDEIQSIIRCFEEMPDGVDDSEATRRHGLVVQWYDWCDLKYPGTVTLQDWEDMAAADGEDVDIRLLIRAHLISGYAILLFLEACYAVDRALCGTDVEAVAMVKMWHMPHDMRAYKYILSEERVQWWVRELAEIENEIKSPKSNRISLFWRVTDLRRCLAKLEAAVHCGDNIKTYIWTWMSQACGRAPPSGLEDGIDIRVEQLFFSVKCLSRTLQQRDQGAFTQQVVPSPSQSSVESGGIRQRLLRAASPSTGDHELPAGRIFNVDEESIRQPSGVTSSGLVVSPLGATLSTPNPNTLLSLFKLAKNRVTRFVSKYKTNGLLEWFIHKETVLVICILSVAMSAYFMAWSAKLANPQPASPDDHGPFADSSFLGNLSRAILSNLSIYLITVATAHGKSGCLHYQSWLWVLLALSFVSSILGLSLYSAIPSAVTIFLWVAAFVQVVVILLLMTMAGIPEKENDVESHRDRKVVRRNEEDKV
ncbi:hypothetical protein VTL71DRAFT_14852 [Oculimacula yallundae]|uniref:Uncharacterized protein n=1 Tax=Oculimacula yallundae TaxID=86028 RepID=A0ABR4CFI6_9HELO